MSGAQMFSVTRTITVISNLPAEFLCSNILTESIQLDLQSPLTSHEIQRQFMLVNFNSPNWNWEFLGNSLIHSHSGPLILWI